MIQYHITPIDPAAHLFAVRLTLDKPAPNQAFQCPDWIPGSYMIRNFARHLIGITAEDNHGQPLCLRQRDKLTWQLECSQAPSQVTLTYQVYAWEQSVRAAALDAHRGFFNGSSVFLAVVDRTDAHCHVHIAPPAPQQVQEPWRVATTLPRAGAEPWGFGDYCAANYDELIDHPVTLGAFTPGTFAAGGLVHDIVFTGQHRVDMPQLQADLEKICSHHLAFWGDPLPQTRYVFMTQVTSNGYGGLEHRDSTALMASRSDLPQPGRPQRHADYLKFLGLCSHEYFHRWNVKQLKPQAFMPYRLDQENYTELLWWFEGITSYYDDLALVRTGLCRIDQYLQGLSETITRVYCSPGRWQQSLAQSSFNTWTKFYLQDENAPNAITNYYTKGSLLALALDLAIRARTQHQQSLDDLVRAARWRWLSTGMPERGPWALAQDVLNCDITDLLDLGVHGVDDLPLAELLATVGVQLNWGLGGAVNAGQTPPPASLGGIMTADPLGVRLKTVYQHTAAHVAGLSAGDIIVACDGIRAQHPQLETQLGQRLPGSVVQISYFRQDELWTTSCTLQAGEASTAALVVTDLLRLQAWLSPKPAATLGAGANAK